MAILAIAVGFSGCDFHVMSSCEDTIKSSSKSPGGKYIAAVYERNCGATTDFVTHVNLRMSSANFKGGKNVVFVAKGKHQVSVEWENDGTLRVQCADCSESQIYAREKSWKNILITY
jgi:hypothetical protein